MQSELLGENEAMVLNTYFMDRLTPKHMPEAEFLQQCLEQHFSQCYPSIRNWVKADIFSKKYLVFPYNKADHWSVFIVYNH